MLYVNKSQIVFEIVDAVIQFVFVLEFSRNLKCSFEGRFFKCVQNSQFNGSSGTLRNMDENKFIIFDDHFLGFPGGSSYKYLYMKPLEILVRLVTFLLYFVERFQRWWGKRIRRKQTDKNEEIRKKVDEIVDRGDVDEINKKIGWNGD